MKYNILFTVACLAALLSCSDKKNESNPVELPNTSTESTVNPSEHNSEATPTTTPTDANSTTVPATTSETNAPAAASSTSH